MQTTDNWRDEIFAQFDALKETIDARYEQALKTVTGTQDTTKQKEAFASFLREV